MNPSKIEQLLIETSTIIAKLEGKKSYKDLLERIANVIPMEQRPWRTFQEHLDLSSKIVSKWPEWKKSALSGKL